VKDTGLKEMLFRHHWVQRHFAQPEVEIFLPGGVTDPVRIITDVDVFCLSPHEDLYFERILGDCRTLKSQSAVNRGLWLSGLMQLVGARSGTVLLHLPAIEQDHKLAAQRVGVTLLTQDEFAVYDRAKVPPGGYSEAGVTVQDLRDLRAAAVRFSGMVPLVTYIYRDAWQERPFRNMIRRLIGHLRGAAGEFDPDKAEHRALLCDASAILSIGLAECAGTVFQNFLHPAHKEELDQHLRMLIWGGRERYEFYQSMRAKLLEARAGEQADLSALELPEWAAFLQLVRSLLDQPGKAFEVPWLLRQYAVDVFRGRPFQPRVTRADAIPLKQAMTVLDYACKAAGVPREFAANLVGDLVGVQAALVTSQAERCGEGPDPE
jgi:hypothetical protein